MAASIVTALNKLNQSKAFFEDFLRETKGGIGEIKAKVYIKKIEWILLDFKTITCFTDAIRESVKKEIESDSFQSDALHEKCLLLEPEKRELIENLIDALLKGEEIKIVDKNNY